MLVELSYLHANMHTQLLHCHNLHVQAFGAVEAMSDRYCIQLNLNLHISAQDLLSCCKTCGSGSVSITGIAEKLYVCNIYM